MNESMKFPPEWHRDVLEARRKKIADGAVECFTVDEVEARLEDHSRKNYVCGNNVGQV